MGGGVTGPAAGWVGWLCSLSGWVLWALLASADVGGLTEVRWVAKAPGGVDGYFLVILGGSLSFAPGLFGI